MFQKAQASTIKLYEAFLYDGELYIRVPDLEFLFGAISAYRNGRWMHIGVRATVGRFKFNLGRYLIGNLFRLSFRINRARLK